MIMSPRSSGRSRQQGNAMLLVLLLTSTALGLTTVAYRATDDAIRVEDYQRKRDFRDEVITSGLVSGVQLLRTGPPPADPFRYVLPNQISGGGVFFTLVEIERNPLAQAGSGEAFVVTARQGTLADSLKYGLPPLDFDGGAGEQDEKDEKGKDNRGVGWGVGGVPPGADQGKKGGKD